jgi:fumarate reductase flavoprotein subunit
MNGMSLVNYKGAILVNKDGRRFCRESDVYLDLSWAGLRQPETLMIQVYDAAIREDYMRWQLAHVLGLCRETKADTVADLGAALQASHGVDAEGLRRTIDAYNGHVESGSDPEFGRTHCVGVAGALRKLLKPPFYAAVLVPGTTHFNGGLLVNRNMQVIDRDGDIVLGLYAAGEVIGGFHGAGYMSGSFVGSSMIFGRVAGKNAADEATHAIQAGRPDSNQS